MTSLVLFWLLTTSCYFLGSRAKITSVLWSRYPRRFAKFMDCPACSGFHYGYLLAYLLGIGGHALPFGLPPQIDSYILVGLCSIVWTPFGAALLQRAFEINGSVIPDE